MCRSPAHRFACFALGTFLACSLAAATARAIIHLDTGDPTQYTSTPGDNSGWQYLGTWGGFLGTPIAPNYFISAAHIGQQDSTFYFHGVAYTVLESHRDPASDLLIWHVQQTFPVYAPLFINPVSTVSAEVGQELHVFGRGTQRGDAMTLDDALRGWAWGPGDGVVRWGRNIVTAAVGDSSGPYLQSAFDNPGLPAEAHLSAGDSGGPMYVMQNGLWCLAGVNYGVDDLFTSPTSGSFAAAIFDARGYYGQNPDGSITEIGGTSNVPTSFYCTQIAAEFSWIQEVVGTNADLTVLPTESFDQWVQAYFTPDQIADATVGGPDADPDGDGVPNLLEFAYNLDPTFAEPVVMTAGTGVRGLPLILLEAVAAGDQRLTVEYVRRTAASGSGITYAVQFGTSPDTNAGNWQTGGTEAVTAINTRWERVKVTDTVSVGSSAPARFARVLVTQDTVGSNARSLQQTVIDKERKLAATPGKGPVAVIRQPRRANHHIRTADR